MFSLKYDFNSTIKKNLENIVSKKQSLRPQKIDNFKTSNQKLLDRNSIIARVNYPMKTATSNSTYDLTILGLSPKESHVYITILQGSQWTINELAEETGLSKPQLYRILGTLQKYHLISATGWPKKYYALNPAIAPKNLQNKILNDLQQQSSQHPP